MSFFGKLSSGKFCRFQLDACLDRRYTFMRQFTDVFEIISNFLRAGGFLTLRSILV